MDRRTAVLDEESGQPHGSWRVMSPEIVEIEDDIKRTPLMNSLTKDVYIAVGKDDSDLVKWALDHPAASPGARVFLVHVFPPLTYITTPVGTLSRSQMSQEQVQLFVNEENRKRRNLLQKYISLCVDAEVMVDTILVESKATVKVILDLIPVLNITYLVMGTKRPPSSRRLMSRIGKGEFVQKNAPGSCEVCIVYDGKRVDKSQQRVSSAAMLSSDHQRTDVARRSERSFFHWICFPGKSN